MLRSRPPIDLQRTLAYLEGISTTNQKYFAGIDAGEYKKTPGEGNAAYIVLQAQEYKRAVELAAKDPEPRAMNAHAASELSRILALCHREAIRLNRDFIDLLQEGVVYEKDVIEDIETGRRKRRSNRGLDTNE